MLIRLKSPFIFFDPQLRGSIFWSPFKFQLNSQLHQNLHITLFKMFTVDKFSFSARYRSSSDGDCCLSTYQLNRMERKGRMKVCSEVGGRHLALEHVHFHAFFASLSSNFLKRWPLRQHNSEWCLKIINCSNLQWRRQWKGLGETSYWFLKRFFNGFAFLLFHLIYYSYFSQIFVSTCAYQEHSH